MKYVDDLTLAEAISLPEKLVYIPESAIPMPDTVHKRKGIFFSPDNMIFSTEWLHWSVCDCTSVQTGPCLLAGQLSALSSFEYTS